MSLVQGQERRKNGYDALVAIDNQIMPLLQAKKHVVIKPNVVQPKVPLAGTHADALLGIMDYLAPRFKGPVVIAEASAFDSLEGFENNHYSRVAAEFKSRQVSLVDLNREGKYQLTRWVTCNTRRSSDWANTTWRISTCWEASRKRSSEPTACTTRWTSS